MSFENKLIVSSEHSAFTGLIKSGRLQLCYSTDAILTSIEDAAASGCLRSESVLVSVFRRPGEFFAILQFESGATSCLNLRQCRVESCVNQRFLKLMLHDFTSGLLFELPEVAEKPTDLCCTRLQESVDLAVKGQCSEPKPTMNWLQAFSESANQWPAKLCPTFGFRRSQSLQTVYESEEEDVEDEPRL
jgi:hypothetical protein